eukprot:TRINITY_DN66470_c4_g14_i1.p1 TRINITY_DN66470_c4_g14~~TRINITY_DN66470_c4_g14_i1.p1  ORF type:complete len:118 (+),score=23.49 TRINITY_DN66470_c4_g14_i1:42-395(+)
MVLLIANEHNVDCSNSNSVLEDTHWELYNVYMNPDGQCHDKLMDTWNEQTRSYNGWNGIVNNQGPGTVELFQGAGCTGASTTVGNKTVPGGITGGYLWDMASSAQAERYLSYKFTPN